jgi:hypothetical protein
MCIAFNKYCLLVPPIDVFNNYMYFLLINAIIIKNGLYITNKKNRNKRISIED